MKEFQVPRFCLIVLDGRRWFKASLFSRRLCRCGTWRRRRRSDLQLDRGATSFRLWRSRHFVLFGCNNRCRLCPLFCSSPLLDLIDFVRLFSQPLPNPKSKESSQSNRLNKSQVKSSQVVSSNVPFEVPRRNTSNFRKNRKVLHHN